MMDNETMQKAKDLVRQRGRAANGLAIAQQQLRNAQRTIEFYTPVVARLENECQELDAQLKALGFHDVGHAKGVIAKENQ